MHRADGRVRAGAKGMRIPIFQHATVRGRGLRSVHLWYPAGVLFFWGLFWDRTVYFVRQPGYSVKHNITRPGLTTLAGSTHRLSHLRVGPVRHRSLRAVILSAVPAEADHFPPRAGGRTSELLATGLPGSRPASWVEPQGLNLVCCVRSGSKFGQTSRIWAGQIGESNLSQTPPAPGSPFRVTESISWEFLHTTGFPSALAPPANLVTLGRNSKTG